MQRLGVNTIRVYNVNPLANHDACMSIFNAAGIYVIIDVNTPQMSIDRTSPGSTYTTNYTSFIFSQVENFKGYPNTLARPTKSSMTILVLPSILRSSELSPATSSSTSPSTRAATSPSATRPPTTAPS
jgi:hypothetical protein